MKIALSMPATSSTTRFDLTTLPSTYADKGSKGMGIFLIVFSLFWGGIPTAMLILTIAFGKFEPGMLFLLIFSVIGAALFLGGLSLVFGSTTTVIDNRRVSVTKKSLFGTTQWSEQLSAFEGVLSRSEYHQGGKNQPSYTLYIVELRHADPKKAVNLYTSRSDLGFRTVWEDSCRLLNMPALEADGKGFVKRDVGDLDKSVKELVKEGKMKVDFDPARPPPHELSLRVDSDVLELTVVKKKSSVTGLIVALVVPCVFMYVGFFVKNCPIFFGVVGVVVFVLVLAGVTWSMMTREQIRIGKDNIQTRQLTPWGVGGGKDVRSADVEVVRIGKENGQGPDGVILESDGANIFVGKGLSPESLEWLKNCVLRVIST